jgi:hypothetical protein
MGSLSNPSISGSDNLDKWTRIMCGICSTSGRKMPDFLGSLVVAATQRTRLCSPPDLTQQIHWKGFKMIPNKRVSHRESFEKMAAVFLTISFHPSPLIVAGEPTPFRPSVWSWPLPGNAHSEIRANSYFQRPTIVSLLPRFRATCATRLPPSVSSRTASTLNSLLKLLRDCPIDTSFKEIIHTE